MAAESAKKWAREAHQRMSLMRRLDCEVIGSHERFLGWGSNIRFAFSDKTRVRDICSKALQ